MNKNIIKKYIIGLYISLLMPFGHSMESRNSEVVNPSSSRYEDVKFLHEKKIQEKFKSIQNEIVKIFDIFISNQKNLIMEKAKVLSALKNSNEDLFKKSQEKWNKLSLGEKENFFHSIKKSLPQLNDFNMEDIEDFVSPTSLKDFNSSEELLAYFIQIPNTSLKVNSLCRYLFINCNNFFDIFRLAGTILSKAITSKYNDLLSKGACNGVEDHFLYDPQKIFMAGRKLDNVNADNLSEKIEDHSSKHYFFMVTIMRHCLPYLPVLENPDIFDAQSLRNNPQENKKKILISHYFLAVETDHGKKNRDDCAHDFYQKFKNIPAPLLNYTPDIVRYLAGETELLPSLESQCHQFFGLYTEPESNCYFKYQEKEDAWIKKIKGANKKNKEGIKKEYEKDKKKYIESPLETLNAIIGSALRKDAQMEENNSSGSADKKFDDLPPEMQIYLKLTGKSDSFSFFK